MSDEEVIDGDVESGPEGAQFRVHDFTKGDQDPPAGASGRPRVAAPSLLAVSSGVEVSDSLPVTGPEEPAR